MLQNPDAFNTLSNPSVVINDGVELNNTLLFAKPVSSNSTITIRYCGKKHVNRRCQPIVCATLDQLLIEFKGEWLVETVPMARLLTLISFLDHIVKKEHATRSEYVPEHSEIIRDRRNLAMNITPEAEDKSFIEMVIRGIFDAEKNSVYPVINFIRDLEVYWVTCFLVSQALNHDEKGADQTIRSASKVYGLSESHFRKLCHSAFTCGPKKQLRMWRAAYSALQLVEKEQLISTIACENGFSSSSHFSAEIKSFFGMSPKDFKRLEESFYE
ncbi:helix-turn-helix domain-containing protein [Pantoea agglomerans]|uniref:helix-turn-helix domain-containing protein n=1 Tax=Enterobacter agglomerans TaxID=549 RepID=UPI0013BD9F84|nr:helix-turn-helix domain-containing protein [Pantoea agglomerans]NEG59862.1 helix-turn-helix domain-containing protein [Pantoea agglomerans]NEG98831.1 helix-turn-helix domain-containing protein [Pantoea agglomerans]NEH05185.1 helix-turn-helix domain-containing protein [Pantoea agglomerans]NEH16174.1 helix-turn-helix domain-containing protein [Pantoea agglomerans]